MADLEFFFLTALYSFTLYSYHGKHGTQIDEEKNK